MARLDTRSMTQSAILRLNADRALIDMSPSYQRQPDIWTLDKKQLLIDSIINDYDIPKLYFRDLRKLESRGTSQFEYAVIDGKQRLKTIWDFIDNKFRLSDEFEYLDDPKVELANLSYDELGERYPSLKIRFDTFTLPIILVDTDEEDLIDDLFSRLNEAVPLKAPEKRRAMGGAVIAAVSRLSLHELFKSHVRIGNKRLQHHEIAIRLLYLEQAFDSHEMHDTKRIFLDDFARRFHDKTKEIHRSSRRCNDVLDELVGVFEKDDALLRSQASIPIYYLACRSAVNQKKKKNFTRSAIESFVRRLERNSKLAAEDISKAKFDLLEYDNMTRQGTNDVGSIENRTKILCKHLKILPLLPTDKE